MTANCPPYSSDCKSLDKDKDIEEGARWIVSGIFMAMVLFICVCACIMRKWRCCCFVVRL